MDDADPKIIINNNIKYLATEPNIKSKNLLLFSPIIKEKLHKLNYKLYKYNELNRKTNKRILYEVNEKDLFSNIIIQNKKNYIKNLYQLNTDSESIDNNNNYNYIKPLKNFHTHDNICKYTMKVFPKNIRRNKFYSLKKTNYLPKMTCSNYIKNHNENISPINNHNKEKINLCLVPLLQLYKKKFNVQKNKCRINLNNREISENNSYYNKTIYTKLKNKWKNRMKKDLLESKIDENDMKPKNRFINLKKELLEQTLKINRMFVVFNKQIKEKEKTIKFIGKFRFKTKLDKNNINF